MRRAGLPMMPRSSAFAVVAFALWTACSHRIPEPRAAAQVTDALTEVDYPPPPARVEFLPEKPVEQAVWVKGEWIWSGRRWSWRAGMWVVPSDNAAYARPVLVRRSDGKLFFAPGTWRDEQGNELPTPPDALARSVHAGIVNPKGEDEPTAADVQLDGGSDTEDGAPAP